MFMPDGEGNPVQVNFLHLDVTSLPGDYLSIDDVESKITFWLYTKKNPQEGQQIKIDDRIKKTDFDIQKPTKFITHGWLSSGNSTTCTTIKDAYLKHYDYNVIIVDWATIASSVIYPIPMLKVKPVAKFYASFLDNLISQGADSKKIHLIGHSLGAHVSGLAGEAVTKGKIDRVTGLDPALPGFRVLHLVLAGRISKKSADFVDVIHSCAGILGLDNAVGHVDFYPNSGLPPQPGCQGINKVLKF